MKKYIKTLIILIIILALIIIALLVFPKESEKNGEAVIDTSEWQTYDEEASGIKAGVLSNFKYPKGWFTYNFAGGTRVAIVFSDGGDIKNTEELYRNESDEEKSLNECKIKIIYDGQDNSYRIEKENSKEIIQKQTECDKIINSMKKQIK